MWYIKGGRSTACRVTIRGVHQDPQDGPYYTVGESRGDGKVHEWQTIRAYLFATLEEYDDFCAS